MIIYHITSNQEWENAKKAGSYSARSLPKDGFIHCSLSRQIVGVANHLFKGQKDLLLLEIDEAKLEARCIHEDLYNLNDNYPHIYGEINASAVIRTIPFPPNVDGSFSLPASVHQ